MTHTKECEDYNSSFYGDKANLGECICPENKCVDCDANLTEIHDQKSHEFFNSIEK